MMNSKLSVATLVASLALGAVFAPTSYALRAELEDSDVTDGAPDDLKQNFTVDGKTYQAWAGLNLNVSEEGQAHVQAALLDGGAPGDITISYIIRCAGTWESTTHIAHSDDFVSDDFDISCHIPGELVESVIARFYFGPFEE